MKAQYDALVKLSQPLAYWPLGRFLGRELVGGLDFAFTSNKNDPEGDHTWFAANESVSRNVVMTATNNMTIEIWYRPRSLVGGGGGIWSNASGGSNGYTMDIPGTTGTRDLRFRMIAQSVAILAVSTRSMMYGMWNHVVGMRNAGTWQYFLNGELDTANAGGNAPITPTGSTVIKSATSPSADVRGFALYNRVLTPSEIRDHYLMGMAHIGPMFVASPDTTLMPIVDYIPAVPVIS